jgi:hypothetical protein
VASLRAERKEQEDSGVYQCDPGTHADEHKRTDVGGDQLSLRAQEAQVAPVGSGTSWL